MTWDDQPTPSAEEAPATAQAPITRPEAHQSPVHRTVLTAVLGAALLVAGGVAVVAAASPDPSGSPAPVASDDSSTSGTERSRTGERHDRPCPDDETDGSGGSDGSSGSDGDSGSDGGQSADPSPSTETPAT